MTFEELIYKRFSESEELAAFLAVFSGRPAVFSPAPPDDNQKGWGSKTQYPRVVYNFDMQANEERKSAGVLSVSLICQNTGEVVPEDIEPTVRKCLKDVLLKPEGSESLFAFAWARTDAFELQETKNDLLIGCDVRFDILEYTNQETSDPDPVMAMDSYIKEKYHEYTVVGYDRMEEITVASKENPVFYCRLISVDKAEETNTVAWMDGRIAVHILCPDNGVRLKLAADIANSLSLDGEVIMLDKSPMFIRRLQMDNKSDYLKDGQVFVTGRYGLLRYRAKPHGLNHIIY